MVTQIKPQPHLTFLDSGKCFICGQGVSDEGYLKPLQMHFCQRHLAELLQKIMDWANNETFYRESYQNYTKDKEIER